MVFTKDRRRSTTNAACGPADTYDTKEYTCRTETKCQEKDKCYNPCDKTYTYKNGGSHAVSAHATSYGYGSGDYGWGAGLVGFLILAVIAFVIIWVVKPDWAQQKDYETDEPTGEINACAALGWAIVIALIIIVLVALVRYACTK